MTKKKDYTETNNKYIPKVFRKDPTVKDIRFTVADLNRICGFKPPIRNTEGREATINKLMMVQGALDIKDSQHLCDVSNWTLMRLGVGPWKTKSEKEFPNPYKGISETELTIQYRLQDTPKKKKSIPELVGENPLSMLTFNPFTEDSNVGSQIIFQYMQDPTQSYSEVIRKMQEVGFACAPEYARLNLATAKKVLRYLQLYQGYHYGLEKRRDFDKERRSELNNALYSPRKEQSTKRGYNRIKSGKLNKLK